MKKNSLGEEKIGRQRLLQLAIASFLNLMLKKNLWQMKVFHVITADTEDGQLDHLYVSKVQIIRKGGYSKMKKSVFRKSIPILIITLLLNFVVVFAQGEQSSSPGTPGQKPLNLSSVTLENGSGIDVAGGITTKPKFKVTFDKNVVNMLYWENNAKCFSIVSASNQVVPVNVTKIDDTVDFNQRQNIFVQPSVELSPGTSYVLKISPQLTAKNGIKLGGSTSGKDLTINFKTKGQAPSTSGTPSNVTGQTPSTSNSGTISGTTPPPAGTSNTGTISGTKQSPTKTPANNTSNTGKSTTGTAINKNQNAAGTPGTQKNVNNQQVSGTRSIYNWGLIVLVLAIICWIVFEFVIRRRKKNKNKRN